MANPIQEAPLANSSFVDSSSRYINSTILYYGVQKFVTFETYKKKEIPTTANDRFYQITKGTEYRPDLVANKAYGIPELWWKLMEANNIKDIWDFKSGITIRIPNNIS